MKARLLIRNHPITHPKVTRVYLEPDFDLADDDLKMLRENETECEWSLLESEVYNWKSIEADIIRENQ